jgi:hypothetical protein
MTIDRKFQPCHVEEGDEAFQTGIFELNVTRPSAYMGDHADRYPIELKLKEMLPVKTPRSGFSGPWRSKSHK